jgi:hypothetical protein
MERKMAQPANKGSIKLNNNTFKAKELVTPPTSQNLLIKV